MKLSRLPQYLAFAGMAVGLSAQSFAAFSYFDTFTNTDWTSAGTGGMRNNGTGSIDLTGVSGTVTGAFLFWHGPTNSSDPLANAAVTFNGNNITGTNIGISADNNWGFANSQAYRADVTSLVSGNGSYSLTNFVKSGGINVNGASLYVTFDDGNATNNRDLVLFNGNDSNIQSSFDAQGWDVTLNGINYSGGPANLHLTVSDGQAFTNNGVVLNDEALSVNGNIILPVGPNWQGLLGPDAGFGNGSLWDEKTIDLAPSLSNGINNLHITTDAPISDALSLVVAAIDLPAGDAPPPPSLTPVPEPSTYGMLSAASLLGVVAIRRRKKK